MNDLAPALHRLDQWWESIPEDQRRPLYRPREVLKATGIPLADLPYVVEIAGWRRASRRLIGEDGRRKKRIFYAPPGYQVPNAAPRGRPPTTIYTILNKRPPSDLAI